MTKTWINTENTKFLINGQPTYFEIEGDQPFQRIKNELKPKLQIIHLEDPSLKNARQGFLRLLNLTPVSCYNIKEEIVIFYRIKLLQING